MLLDPPTLLNVPCSTVIYVQLLPVMHILLELMIQFDQTAASANGIVRNSLQHEDQWMLIRKTVTESVNLVSKIQQLAQVLGFLLCITGYYS